MPLIFADLYAPQILALPRRETVFFLPVGPLEDHGPHLPVGLDPAEAEKLAFLTAEKLEQMQPGWVGVLLPRVPLGVEGNTSFLALTVRAHVLRDYLVDVCYALHRQGFPHFVCVSGLSGPKQLTAIEEAGKLLRRKVRPNWILRLLKWRTPVPTLVSANSALVKKNAVRHAPFYPRPAEHGGQRDTSVGLYLEPQQVAAAYRELPTQSPPDSGFTHAWNYRRHRIASYWGNPAAGTAEAGERDLRERLEILYPKLRAVWEGSHPDRIFRSWYSILPPNQSFFRAWILVILLSLLLVVWVYFSLRGITGS